MFALDYRIVLSDFDDFPGQNCFFQIKCNGFMYGDIYPPEIECIMDKDSLADWFERMDKAAEELERRDNVFLSDVESYNTWIAFQRKGGTVAISIIRAEKKPGTPDMVFALGNMEIGEWSGQEVDFCQFKAEVL